MGSKKRLPGSASALSLSRPAQASLTLRPAGSLSRPQATFVTRLQPMRLPAQAARQLPDQSTTLRVDSSSTDDSRLRGALPIADSCTATSETEPAAILRGGAPQVGCSRLAYLMRRSWVNPRSVRLLRMRSVSHGIDLLRSGLLEFLHELPQLVRIDVADRVVVEAVRAPAADVVALR